MPGKGIFTFGGGGGGGLSALDYYGGYLSTPVNTAGVTWVALSPWTKEYQSANFSNNGLEWVQTDFDGYVYLVANISCTCYGNPAAQFAHFQHRPVATGVWGTITQSERSETFQPSFGFESQVIINYGPYPCLTGDRFRVRARLSVIVGLTQWTSYSYRTLIRVA